MLSVMVSVRCEAAAAAASVLGSWGKTMRDAVRNTEMWGRPRTSTQDPSTGLSRGHVAAGTYRFWRDLGYFVGAITSAVLADAVGIRVRAAAAPTCRAPPTSFHKRGNLPTSIRHPTLCATLRARTAICGGRGDSARVHATPESAHRRGGSGG